MRATKKHGGFIPRLITSQKKLVVDISLDHFFFELTDETFLG